MPFPSDATPEAAVPAATDAAGTGLPTVDALMDEQPPADGDAAPPHYRLPQAAVPPNIMLQAAVARLVEQKERIDLLAREGLLDGLFPAEWSAMPGNELRAFVASVVPFASDSVRGETVAARAPLKYLLGQSHRWGKADVAEPRSLGAFLASDERAGAGAADAAEVMLLGPLGLGWAQVGRSRVGFLRAMGVESLAARVTALPYPAPEQLALYHVTVAGVAQVWCVLDSRRLRALSAPSLTVPLLTAYGVAAPQAWPAQWPDPVEVEAEIGLARAGNGAHEVDLVRLVDKIQRSRAGEAWSSASLMQLHTWVPRWRFFLTSFIGLPAALLLIAALALPGRVEAAAVAVALGFAGGAIAALAAPWIYARRKFLS
ncbi:MULTISPECIES: hypothetical protein [Stenotrophomonas]|uniref:Membrane protein n=1 Tax=Stenotrophomonas nitritireducens TaxID=83617 RepID=A0ABR5NJ21_9GAMM|nr:MULTISPECIES: hypothetical protein [Stenotrophomonas]KQO00254.1 hypothetical protein ASF01_04690 [Stenotrophomonas sp. Leaf70]KRG56847.1 membrane protein [Stenotrophomonas nitritireducens]